jgi:hypothetical protein
MQLECADVTNLTCCPTVSNVRCAAAVQLIVPSSMCRTVCCRSMLKMSQHCERELISTLRRLCQVRSSAIGFAAIAHVCHSDAGLPRGSTCLHCVHLYAAVIADRV